MGSDDLFHKRKARKTFESVRQRAKRKPYDKVLIVCEGEKTEPIYFEEMRVILELDSANIEIDGSCGSSPISVVMHAYNLCNQELNSGDGYNKVFCVFDRDNHSSFDDAIHKIDQINREFLEKGISDQLEFKAIISIPSFEYWFLIHYTPTTKPYAPTPHRSVGDQVIDDLKIYLPDYKKTQHGLYEKSLHEETLQGAIANSVRIFSAAKKSGNINPSTNVHELVLYLQSIKT